MLVLIGCESSGVVREAFAARGHTAYSNDILPADDGSHLHLQCDVIEAMHACRWDLAILHPPCTYLTSAGLHWNARGRLVDGRPRAELTEDALLLVRLMMTFPFPWAIENPVGCISSQIRKPDQIIQPYQFGDDASKATCLWLHDVPKLKPTDYLPPRMVCGCGHTFTEPAGDKYGCPNCGGEHAAKPRWSNQTDSGQNNLPPSAHRWKLRSKTYPGIAAAMANQWG